MPPRSLNALFVSFYTSKPPLIKNIEKINRSCTLLIFTKIPPKTSKQPYHYHSKLPSKNISIKKLILYLFCQKYFYL